jgi:hypothetical protein
MNLYFYHSSRLNDGDLAFMDKGFNIIAKLNMGLLA